MGQQIPKEVISGHIDALEMMDREDLIKIIKSLSGDGIILNFHGKRTAQEIDKKVRPRQTIIKKEYCVGTAEEQACNMMQDPFWQTQLRENQPPAFIFTNRSGLLTDQADTLGSELASEQRTGSLQPWPNQSAF